MEKLKLMWREFWEERWVHCARRFWVLAQYEATKLGNSEQDRKKARKLIRKMWVILQAEKFCMKMLGDY